jgi:Bacterial inner membrane protein
MPFLEAWPAFFRAAAGNLDLFGLLGLSFGFATGLMPRRRLILLSSAVCSLCFSIHFLRLGSPTGMAMNLIGVVQSLLAARFVTERGRPAWLAAVFAAAFLLAAILTLATWNGLPSVFAGLATLVSTAARLQSSPQTMRLLLIGSGLGWASHNALVGSVCGLTCDCLGLIGFTVAFLRERGANRRPQASLAALL